MKWWNDEGNVLEVVAIVATSLNDPMLDRHLTAETDSAVTKHPREWTVSALCAMLHRTSPGQSILRFDGWNLPLQLWSTEEPFRQMS